MKTAKALTTSETACTEAAATADAELLRRAAAGDEEAFAALYRRHQPRLFRFALHMGAPAGLAEETCQEVFLKWLRSGFRFDPERGRLESYLCGVARHLLCDHFRHQAAETDWEEAGVEPADGALETWALMAQQERLAALQKALASLPWHYREVIALCDLSELSYAEAAVVLNCSPGTIASRRSRALKLLASKLQTQPATESTPPVENPRNATGRLAGLSGRSAAAARHLDGEDRSDKAKRRSGGP